MMGPTPAQGFGMPPSRPPAGAASLQQIRQFIMNSMPVAAMAHSFHVQALREPALRNDPAVQRFSLVELNELHHMVSAMGDLLRLQQRDQTALNNLAYNLAGFLQNRTLGLQLEPQLPAAARQNPAMQRSLALTMQTQQQLNTILPTLQAFIQSTGVQGPGPLLVRGG